MHTHTLEKTLDSLKAVGLGFRVWARRLSSGLRLGVGSHNSDNARGLMFDCGFRLCRRDLKLQSPCTNPAFELLNPGPRDPQSEFN